MSNGKQAPLKGDGLLHRRARTSAPRPGKRACRAGGWARLSAGGQVQEPKPDGLTGVLLRPCHAPGGTKWVHGSTASNRANLVTATGRRVKEPVRVGLPAWASECAGRNRVLPLPLCECGPGRGMPADSGVSSP